jgi:hypothetical protein
MIDLHTHSFASDGTLSPVEVARAAKKAGLTAAALTDHDTVGGIDEFLDECARLGIAGVSGVEISAKYKKEMHILGLFVNENDKEFVGILKELRSSREKRNKKALELARENGFNISEADILSQKDGATLANTGRAHIGRALVNKGYAKDVQDAFDRYLSKGNPLYAERKTFSPKDSIELIHRAGGIAVLAHPIFITDDETELRAILTELKEYGLDGVECFYSEYTDEFEEMCLKICGELRLLKTGGSDFHGATKPHIRIGHMTNGRQTPDGIFEELLRYKHRSEKK